MRYYCCIDCSKIDKSKKQTSGINYRYGCETNDFTCGWLRKDSDLKNMGCSNHLKIEKLVKIEHYEQLSLF